jgi:hypothetical protein
MAALIFISDRMEASVKDNPYSSIVGRNCFDLRQMISQPANQQPEGRPIPQIRLTGVTNLGGRNKALLEITAPGKPTTRAILSEGERRDAIEVLRINVIAGNVQLLVAGIETVVALEAASTLAQGSASATASR